MLSDAAMGNSTTSGRSSNHSPSNTPNSIMQPSTLTAPVALPTSTQQQSWTMGPGPAANSLNDMMLPPNPHDVPAVAGGDAGLMAGYPMGPVEMDNFGFTSDELMAMGNLMEDPAWFSFGFEQGGWGF